MAGFHQLPNTADISLPSTCRSLRAFAPHSVRTSTTGLPLLRATIPVISFLFAPVTLADDLPTPNPAASPSRPAPVSTSTVEVIGDTEEDLEAVPGAASVVSKEELLTLQPFSANEVFRSISGVHVLEEDGIGLRMNLGFRGLDPDRSRTVLVLEDGVPVAPAPYSAPELYYSPMIERMERVEVSKGSGAIQWGPQTIGGVVNYVTAEPPWGQRVEMEARVGGYQYQLGRVFWGETRGQIGYSVQGHYQHFEGPRSLGLQRADLSSKLRLQLSSEANLGVKLSLYDETSRASYLGLTSAQYETDPNLNAAIHDLFRVRRLGLSATHQWMYDRLLIRTTAYGHVMSRHWRRQDYARTSSGIDYERAVDASGNTITGDAIADVATDGSAVFFEDAAGHRNRDFGMMGLESRQTLMYGGSTLKGELDTGIRFHHEEGKIVYLQSTDAEAESGEIISDELRTVQALSAFAHNRFSVWNRLHISPGLRLELIHSDRAILRQAVDPETGTPDASGMVMDAPPVYGEVTTLDWIPGIGFSWNALPELTLFGGVHRGFAPPRNQDAINANGTVEELAAELSLNYELGARLRTEWMEGEITGFLLDFENQIIPSSESSGGSAGGSGVVNSGATRHMGVEARAGTELLRGRGGAWALPASVSYTFVHARFQEGWSDLITGNVLPYAPEQLFSAQLAVERHATRRSVPVRLGVATNYVGPQFSDRENTLEPSVDGLKGLIEGRWIVDARLSSRWYQERIEVSVTGKNVLDARYIASRRPAGIQPGAPRQWLLGVSGTF